MGAAGGVPAAPEGLRSTAGGTSKLSLFSPNWSSGMGDFAPLALRDAPKLGEGQQAKLEEQRALADKLRDAPLLHEGSYWNARATQQSGSKGDVYETGTAHNDNPFGSDPVTGLGFDASKAQDTGFKDTGEPIDYYKMALGIDPGFEQYEKDYQKSVDPSQWTPWSPEWQNATTMQGLLRAGVNPLHSISGDQRDPYGFGSDYASYWAQAHGGGDAYNKEVARYIGLDPKELGQYENLYGKIPVGDPIAMERWFRRANSGGNYVASQQDRIAQNARTDMTEGAIMSAMMMGMGALAAPATIGYGGTYGASNAFGSTLANQFTADALARQAIGGMGQYGGSG